MSKPFIMNETPQCEKALKYWLKELPYFNSYSRGLYLNNLYISLSKVNNPSSDWARVQNWSGKIICKLEEAQKIAIKIVRQHLNWEAEDNEE